MATLYGRRYLSTRRYWRRWFSSQPQEDCRGGRNAGWFMTTTKGACGLSTWAALAKTGAIGSIFWMASKQLAASNGPAGSPCCRDRASPTSHVAFGTSRLACWISEGEMSIPVTLTCGNFLVTWCAKAPCPHARSRSWDFGPSSNKRMAPGKTSSRWWKPPSLPMWPPYQSATGSHPRRDACFRCFFMQTMLA